MVNSIVNYFSRKPGSSSLPSPSGSLSRQIPPTAILSDNEEVEKVLESSKLKKRGSYRKYPSEEWANNPNINMCVKFFMHIKKIT